MALMFRILTMWFVATWAFSIYQGEVRYLHPVNLTMSCGLLVAALFAFGKSRTSRIISSGAAILFTVISILQIITLLFVFSSSEGFSFRVLFFDVAMDGGASLALLLFPLLAYGSIATARVIAKEE